MTKKQVKKFLEDNLTKWGVTTMSPDGEFVDNSNWDDMPTDADAMPDEGDTSIVYRIELIPVRTVTRNVTTKEFK